mgnify:FL=1
MITDYASLPTGLFPEDTDLDNAYILYDHTGGLICVYGDANRAIDRAVEEITKDYQYDQIHVDAFDWVIIVRSPLGEITILIEKIQ